VPPPPAPKVSQLPPSATSPIVTPSSCLFRMQYGRGSVVLEFVDPRLTCTRDAKLLHDGGSIFDGQIVPISDVDRSHGPLCYKTFFRVGGEIVTRLLAAYVDRGNAIEAAAFCTAWVGPLSTTS
jgi:hypothetical protein